MNVGSNGAVTEAAKKVEDASTEQIVGTLSTTTVLTLNGRILPVAVDDLDADLGHQVYERMLSEPCLAASDDIVRIMAMEAPLQFGDTIPAPREGDTSPEAIAQNAEHEQAEEIRSFVEWMIDQLVPSMRQVEWRMLGAYAIGHRLAELVKEIRTYNGEKRLVVRSIKPKPRTAYNLAVTKFMDFLGAVPGAGRLLYDYENKPADAFVPAENLFLFTMRSENGDPRGKAALRPCYTPWREKQSARVESSKTVSQFGGGMVTLEIPPMSGSAPKGFGSWAEYYQALLVNMATGGAMTIPQGAKFTIHTAGQGASAIFDSTFDRCDREMVLAYLKSVRATMESKYGSKADSQTSYGLLTSVINWLRQEFCEAFREQVVRPIVAANWGAEAAEKYTPTVSMEELKDQDVPALITAVSTGIASGAIQPWQMPFWDSKIGQPVRESADVEAMNSDGATEEVAPDSGASFCRPTSRAERERLSQRLKAASNQSA